MTKLDEAIQRASMLITLLRCIEQGDRPEDLGLDLIDTDRHLAESLLLWIGEENARTLEDLRP